LVGEYLEHLEEVARGVGKTLSDVRDVRGVAQILAWGRRLGLRQARTPHHPDANIPDHRDQSQ
jgi:hypothetical protein